MLLPASKRKETTDVFGIGPQKSLPRSLARNPPRPSCMVSESVSRHTQHHTAWDFMFARRATAWCASLALPSSSGEQKNQKTVLPLSVALKPQRMRDLHGHKRVSFISACHPPTNLEVHNKTPCKTFILEHSKTPTKLTWGGRLIIAMSPTPTWRNEQCFHSQH